MQTFRDQLVGQTIDEYRVERFLGRGRLSAVYLAQRPPLHTNVALTTFILPSHTSSEARSRFSARFHKEVAALASLHHRHLMPIHAYGEHGSLPYLVTPYMMHGSLADVLKQQGRCQPGYVLGVLEQIASGLEYAHKRGVVHGSLKPANILLDGQQGICVAGFGLMQILQLRGIEPSEKPYAHLLSVAGTFLGSPEYLAPEAVMGHLMDARSDIYALGIVLFELLCGKPPFAGASALEVAQQHVNQPLPSLRAFCPDIPIALELVISHALERNPASRFQHVSELVEAFAQVCRGTMPLERIDVPLRDPAPSLPGITDDTDRYGEEAYVATGSWQLMPPIVTGKVVAVQPATGHRQAVPLPADTWQIVPPVVTGQLPAVKPSPAHIAPIPAQQPMPSPLVQQHTPLDASRPMPPAVRQLSAERANHALPNKDASLVSPWWSQGEELLTLSPQARSHTTRLKEQKRGGVSRRKAIALLAVGGVAVAGAAVAVDLNLGRIMSALTSHLNHGTSNGKTVPANNKGTGGQGGLVHTARVIGSTTLALNASADFTNPADGKASLLVHLPNNTFVAYEKACTHQNVAVYYDKGTQKLVCPLHGSLFDPANGGKVLQGPATRPLPGVTIHVNADGTITTL